jgi:anti-sigma B factor antagonist
MTAPPEFGIEVEGSRVTVRGELDSATCDRLAEAVEQALADPATESVVLDLEGVSFIDSAGLRTMIVLEDSARRRDATLEVRQPPEDVMELLRLTGIAERLSLTSTGGPPAREDFIERIELELPGDPLSPGRARAELRDSIASRLDAGALDRATLATSELVTNAVVHADRRNDEPVRLGITVHDDRVRVEVTDSGQGFDPSKPVRATSRGGRGLLVVDRCATRWGTRRDGGEPDGGFCVWFEIETRTEAVRDLAAG